MRRRVAARVVAALALLLVLGLLAVRDRPPGPTGAWLARQGLAPRTLEVDGLRIRYVRTGAGPPLVLLHGLASSIFTWKDVLPALAAHHDVLALDLPGFGGSDVPAPARPERYPDQVLAVLAREGVGPATLVGNSLGGAVAVAVAARRPEAVSGLVLLDAAGYNFAPEERPLLLRLVGFGPLGGLAEALPIRGALVEVGLRQVFHDGARVTRERVDEYRAPLLRPGAARHVQQLLAGAASLGFPGVIRTVRVPTLVVWGREDRWIPVAHAERFARDIAGARVLVLEGCGHMPQEERPEETVRAVEGFVHPTLTK